MALPFTVYYIVKSCGQNPSHPLTFHQCSDLIKNCPNQMHTKNLSLLSVLMVEINKQIRRILWLATF
jgi:hypothetical protein